MTVRENIPKLQPPRYMPLVLKDTGSAAWHDTIENRYLVLCPQCHTLITYGTLGGFYQEMIHSARPRCQGCRARETFERNPGLVGLFLDFWTRTGNFPESTSWLEAISQAQIILWEKEIKAAFAKDQEGMYVPAAYKFTAQKDAGAKMKST